MTRKTRILSSALAFTAIALGGMFVGVSSAQADGDKPCAAKKFQVSQVEKACKDGGQTAAKALMKKVVKAQKAAGNDINCKSCHTSLKTFELKDNAVKDLKKYLK
jgi:hypothetical protein